jgi:hypothetical protein
MLLAEYAPGRMVEAAALQRWLAEWQGTAASTLPFSSSY